MEYMALATGIRVALLTGMTGSAIMEYSLKQGLADKDAEKAFRAAHTLKGICLNLGFSQLIEDVVNITEILRAGKLEGTDELFSKIQTTYENTVAEIKKLD